MIGRTDTGNAYGILVGKPFESRRFHRTDLQKSPNIVRVVKSLMS